MARPVPISFPPFLGDFTGYVQAFGIGAEFFQVNDAISILIAAIQSRHGLFHIVRIKEVSPIS